MNSKQNKLKAELIKTIEKELKFKSKDLSKEKRKKIDNVIFTSNFGIDKDSKAILISKEILNKIQGVVIRNTGKKEKVWSRN